MAWYDTEKFNRVQGEEHTPLFSINLFSDRLLCRFALTVLVPICTVNVHYKIQITKQMYDI